MSSWEKYLSKLFGDYIAGVRDLTDEEGKVIGCTVDLNDHLRVEISKNECFCIHPHFTIKMWSHDLHIMTTDHVSEEALRTIMLWVLTTSEYYIVEDSNE